MPDGKTFQRLIAKPRGVDKALEALWELRTLRMENTKAGGGSFARDLYEEACIIIYKLETNPHSHERMKP